MNSASAPSLCTPRVWLNWQAFGQPRRHDAQLPQLVYGDTATSVPGDSRRSESSVCRIVAEISCPGTRGKETSGFKPRKEFRSLPHNPTIRTFSNKFGRTGTGSGTISTDACPGLWSTSAFILKRSSPDSLAVDVRLAKFRDRSFPSLSADRRHVGPESLLGARVFQYQHLIDKVSDVNMLYSEHVWPWFWEAISGHFKASVY